MAREERVFETAVGRARHHTILSTTAHTSSKRTVPGTVARCIRHVEQSFAEKVVCPYRLKCRRRRFAGGSRGGTWATASLSSRPSTKRRLRISPQAKMTALRAPFACRKLPLGCTCPCLQFTRVMAQIGEKAPPALWAPATHLGRRPLIGLSAAFLLASNAGQSRSTG